VLFVLESGDAAVTRGAHIPGRIAGAASCVADAESRSSVERAATSCVQFPGSTRRKQGPCSVCHDSRRDGEFPRRHRLTDSSNTEGYFMDRQVLFHTLEGIVKLRSGLKFDIAPDARLKEDLGAGARAGTPGGESCAKERRTCHEREHGPCETKESSHHIVPFKGPAPTMGSPGVVATARASLAWELAGARPLYQAKPRASLRIAPPRLWPHLSSGIASHRTEKS
jgi:hypothetical protein